MGKEDQRVEQEVAALQAGDFQKFLDTVQESGDSSFKYLQNIYFPKNPATFFISCGIIA